MTTPQHSCRNTGIDNTLDAICHFITTLQLDRVCKIITERAEDCIIMSLGSGPHAHGQLLIYHDMFGLYPRFKPRMAKVFGNAGEVILNGLTQYVKEVSGKSFPQKENFFTMKDEEYKELMGIPLVCCWSRLPQKESVYLVSARSQELDAFND